MLMLGQPSIFHAVALNTIVDEAGQRQQIVRFNMPFAIQCAAPSIYGPTPMSRRMLPRSRNA
jgi:hypothetical protein